MEVRTTVRCNDRRKQPLEVKNRTNRVFFSKSITTCPPASIDTCEYSCILSTFSILVHAIARKITLRVHTHGNTLCAA